MTNQPPTEYELREWERLTEAATDGPWHLDPNGRVGSQLIDGTNRVSCMGDLEIDHILLADAAFIAAARTGWPRTIAAIRRLERIISDAEDEENHQRGILKNTREELRAKDREIAKRDEIIQRLVARIADKEFTDGVT